MVDTLARSDQLIDANIRRLSKRGRFWLLTVARVDLLPVHRANDHRDHAISPGRKTRRRICGQRHDQRSGRRRRSRSPGRSSPHTTTSSSHHNSPASPSRFVDLRSIRSPMRSP